MLIQHGADTKVRTLKLLTVYDLATSKQVKQLLNPDESFPEEISEDESYVSSVAPSSKKPVIKKPIIITKENKLALKPPNIPKQIRAGSGFFSNLRSVINKDSKDDQKLQKISKTMIQEEEKEDDLRSKHSRSRISETIHDAPIKRSNREMYNNTQSRKSAISVARSVKSRASPNSSEQPFYLPDINANYSEYSKHDVDGGIPKSLKQYRNKTNAPYKAQDNRFKTPMSRKSKKL